MIVHAWSTLTVSVTIQLKASEQYFPVVLFIMPYKVVLTFESVDEILKCDHSNERYRTAFSTDFDKDSYNFVVREWTHEWKLLSNSFIRYCVPNEIW